MARAWFRTRCGAVRCGAVRCGAETESLLVWNGSGVNVVALRATVCQRQAVICTEQSHVNVGECGALELLAGCKLIGLPSPDGKVRPVQIGAVVAGRGDQNAVQPRVLAITQSTDAGTGCSRDATKALCATAHAAGLLVFMDGTRIAHAAG